MATERENAEKKEKKVTGVYIPAPLLKPVMFLLVPTRKNLPVFLPCKRSVPATKRSFSPSAVGAGITHYTLRAKSCAKGTLSPLDSLPRNHRFLWILPAKKGCRPPLESTQKAKRNVPNCKHIPFCFSEMRQNPPSIYCHFSMACPASRICSWVLCPVDRSRSILRLQPGFVNSAQSAVGKPGKVMRALP